MIDKTAYPNLFEGVKDVCLIYHNNDKCVLEFESFAKFLETFPNYDTFRECKPFHKSWTPIDAFFTYDNSHLNDDRYKSFRDLKKLDQIFKHICIEKKICTPH